MGHGRHGQLDADGGQGRPRRRAWQPRLFPHLVEPLDLKPAPPVPAARGGRDPLRRPRPEPERADPDATPPRLTPEARAWLAAIASGETRRAYRRDAAFLMRRLSLDTDAALACVERRDAVLYRDALQRIVDVGGCSAGLARRRMAAALSLYDHLQRQYLVPHNPFRHLRRPREAGAGGDGSAGAKRRPRACGRAGCPVALGLVVLGAAGAAGAAAVPPRPSRRRADTAAGGPRQLCLW